MHLNAQRPVFVPYEFQKEIEQLSKAALMDMVWDFATRCAGKEEPDDVMLEVRTTATIIAGHRKQAKAA